MIDDRHAGLRPLADDRSCGLGSVDAYSSDFVVAYCGLRLGARRITPDQVRRRFSVDPFENRRLIAEGTVAKSLGVGRRRLEEARGCFDIS